MDEIKLDAAMEHLLLEAVEFACDVSEAMTSSLTIEERRKFSHEINFLLDRALRILSEWDANEERARIMLEEEWLASREGTTRKYSKKEIAANNVWFEYFSRLRTLFKNGQIDEGMFKRAVVCLDIRREKMCKRVKFLSFKPSDNLMVIRFVLWFILCSVCAVVAFAIVNIIFQWMK